MSKVQVISITAVGDRCSDKINLLHAIKGDPYAEDYDATVFENFHEMRNYQGNCYEIRLQDTSGQEEYDRLRPMSYAKTDVILMCFSLDNPESLKSVTNQWILETREYCPKVPVILFGTKSELWKPEENGAITQSQIDEVSKEINAYKTILCSARNNINVSGIFDLAIEAYLASKNDGTNSYSYCNIE